MGDPEIIQSQRRYGTTEERHILAIELIADELVLIRQQLGRLGEHFCGLSDFTDGRENPVPVDATHIPAGITRTLIERFQVGAYQYSNIADATAELSRTNAKCAKEVRRLVSRNLGGAT